MKVYGPYETNPGRYIVSILEGKRLRTMSYPRWLMQQHLGRELLPEEHVDHINNDHTDNRLENLQLLTNAENSKKYREHVGLAAEYFTFKCPVCGNEAAKLRSTVRHNQDKCGGQGPYCSRSCASKDSHTRRTPMVPESVVLEAYEDYKKGLTFRQLGEKYEASPATFCKRFKKLNSN